MKSIYWINYSLEQIEWDLKRLITDIRQSYNRLFCDFVPNLNQPEELTITNKAIDVLEQIKETLDKAIQQAKESQKELNNNE